MREELRHVLSNIKVTAPLEYVLSVSEVVQKLLRLCRELFADHLVAVTELLAEVGQILKESGQAECVKVCQHCDACNHHMGYAHLGVVVWWCGGVVCGGVVCGVCVVVWCVVVHTGWCGGVVCGSTCMVGYGCV